MQQDSTSTTAHVADPSVQVGAPPPSTVGGASSGSATTPAGVPAGSAAIQAGTGLTPNVAGALSYFLGMVTGVIFVLLEKKDRFVRFHAFQSMLLSGAWIAFWLAFEVVSLILGQIPVLGLLTLIAGLLLGVVLGLGGLVLWIALMITAYQGKRWKLPIIGAMAERYAAGQRI